MITPKTSPQQTARAGLERVLWLLLDEWHNGPRWRRLGDLAATNDEERLLLVALATASAGPPTPERPVRVADQSIPWAWWRLDVQPTFLHAHLSLAPFDAAHAAPLPLAVHALGVALCWHHLAAVEQRRAWREGALYLSEWSAGEAWRWVADTHAVLLEDARAARPPSVYTSARFGDVATAQDLAEHPPRAA